MKKTLLLALCCILSLTITAQKYVGGDISMLKKFVDEGAIYKDYDDQPVEPLTFFKQQGWNAQRVRLFVDSGLRIRQSTRKKYQGCRFLAHA